jgi:hypothetical protein
MFRAMEGFFWISSIKGALGKKKTLLSCLQPLGVDSLLRSKNP